MISAACPPFSPSNDLKSAVPRFLILALLLLLDLGCNSKPYDIAPVSGVITLDSKPLAGAIINTQPIATENSSSPGPGSFAKTDEFGKYSLELVNPAVPGAVVGPHRVTIRIPERLSETDNLVYNKPTAPLPVEALDGSLQVEVVPEGVANANFDLTSGNTSAKR